jgi:hypothetical protein
MSTRRGVTRAEERVLWRDLAILGALAVFGLGTMFGLALMYWLLT